MKIIVVRHGVAEDRLFFVKKNKNDDLRPLTSEGKKTFIKNSKLIKMVIPKVNKIFSSPLLRALQTAEILEKRYHIKKQIIEELRPDKKFPMLIKKISKYKTVMIVGHEPYLSEFIGYMVGTAGSPVELKKGGVCIVEGAVGKAKILNLLTPKLLSKI